MFLSSPQLNNNKGKQEQRQNKENTIIGSVLSLDRDEAHGPRLPPQAGQGAFYSPDRVVIPCLKDKGRKRL